MSSQREILNLKFRLETAFVLYRFIQSYKPSITQIIDTFSLDTDELVRDALTLLQTVGMVTGQSSLEATTPVDDEIGFKAAFLHSIRSSKDGRVNYLWGIWKQALLREDDYGTDALLSILKSVRREMGLGDETADETGKFDILKPMMTYLGIVGESSTGTRLTFHPGIDPDVLIFILRKFSGRRDYLALANFLSFLNAEYLPVGSERKPVAAIVNSLIALETQGKIRLDDPTDYQQKVDLRERRISRVVIL